MTQSELFVDDRARHAVACTVLKSALALDRASLGMVLADICSQTMKTPDYRGHPKFLLLTPTTIVLELLPLVRVNFYC